jgi:hypothetical protein
VTNEPKGQTEKFIESTQASYAYAYDKGGKLSRQLGIRGYPTAILLDPTGRIAWRGHPGTLTEADISPVLEGSLAKPLFEFGDEAKKVKQALSKGKWAKAVAEANELGDEGADLRQSLAGLISMRAKALDAAWEAKDYLLSHRLAERVADDMEDLPEGVRAEEILDDIKGDKEKKAILKAQEKIAEILEDLPRKDKEFDKAYDKLEKLAEEYPGSAAARDAAAMRDRLREYQSQLNQ